MTANAPIVIDGVFFQWDVTTGIARLWGEILRRWAARDIGRRVVVLHRGRMLPGLEALAIRQVPPLDQAQWESDPALLQAICDELGAAVFLSTYYTHPTRCPSVLWIHDMIPERLGFDLSDPTWRQKHAAIAQASAYACSSAHSLKDLRDIVPAAAAKPGVVAGCGVAPDFHPASDAQLELFRENFIRPNFGGRPYIFMPGNTHGYKNGQLLVQALSGMDCSNLAVLVTMDSPEIARLRAIPNLIVAQTHFNEFGLRLAYASAHCLVCPSIYEGFGLPVVEAMACGCPVICAGTSSLVEVAGDAAILIDPGDAGSLVNALKAMSRPDVRQTYVQRGLVQARKFSWDNSAHALETLALRVAEGQSA